MKHQRQKARARRSSREQEPRRVITTKCQLRVEISQGVWNACVATAAAQPAKRLAPEEQAQLNVLLWSLPRALAELMGKDSVRLSSASRGGEKQVNLTVKCGRRNGAFPVVQVMLNDEERRRKTR